MVAQLQDKQYGLILGAIPRSVREALECPPIQELINQGARVNDLEACLALEIAKVSNMLTVGGNLRQGQSLEIARCLIADYPGESLQDFCLCLRNGMKGHYGEIFRFDILVISEWFKKYLLEKYDAFEERLMREKDNDYAIVQEAKVVPISDFRLVHDYPWVNSPLKDKEARKALWQYQFFAMSQMKARKPTPITDQEIRTEGKIRPVHKPHPSTPLSLIEEKDLHIQYIRENYDPYTAKPKPNWISEDQWRQNLSRVPEAREVLHPEKQTPDA